MPRRSPLMYIPYTFVVAPCPNTKLSRIAAGRIIEMSSIPQKFSWPSWPQWKQLSTVLNPKERRNLIVLAVLDVGFGIAWLWTGYLERTVAIPDAGGEYSEAIVGEPQFINPILAGVNDADKDVGALVYNGLLRYD